MVATEITDRILTELFINQIVEKFINKHNVKQFEIDEVFINQPIFRFIEKGTRVYENVYAGYSQTNTNRYLIVFFVYKKGNQALIISARNKT